MFFLDIGFINEIQFNLVAPIFKLLAWSYDLLISFVDDSLFSSDKIGIFTDSIYVLVGIFMLFRLAISMLNYLINPDSFSDKSTGGTKMLTRIVVSMLLIIGSSFVFDELMVLQKNIVSTDGGIIFRILRLNDGSGNAVSSSVDFPEDGKCVATGGSVLASTSIKAFINYTNIDKDTFEKELLMYFARSNDDSCDANNNSVDGSVDHYNAVNNIKGYFSNEDLNIDMLLALIAGIGIVVFILIMAIDIVVRNLKILLLQMISPVAFVSYMNHKDKIFSQWLKNYGSVYADLFIKLIALAFVIVLVNFLHNNADISGFGAVFYLMGILVFAKAVPSFISKIFGIDGAGSFKESAGMLKKGLGLGVAGVAGLAAAGFAAHKIGAADRIARSNRAKEIQDKMKNFEGDKNSKEYKDLKKQKRMNSLAAGRALSVGRYAKMGLSGAVKGAGAGWQGKGASSAFSGVISEGDRMATAVEGGSTFKQRAFASFNKATGMSFGAGAKIKEQKEAANAVQSAEKAFDDACIDIARKKDTDVKLRKRNIERISEMSGNSGNYDAILKELGVKNSEDRAKIIDDGNAARVIDEWIVNNEKLLIDQEKASGRATASGRDKYVKTESVYNYKEGKFETISTEVTGKNVAIETEVDLVQKSQAFEEAYNKAKIADVLPGDLDVSFDSKGAVTVKVNGQVTDSNPEKMQTITYYEDGKRKTKKVAASYDVKIAGDKFTTEATKYAKESEDGLGAAQEFANSKKNS